MILYEEPLRIERDGNVLIVNGMEPPPSVRTARQMYDVLADRYSLPDPLRELYYMFRGVCMKGTLRYDITIIPSGQYGKEYAKTYGHYHRPAEPGLDYPEIYQVLEGDATFILQKKSRDESVNARMVKGTKGDIVLIPSNYGHASVNSGPETLVLGNIVSSRFESDYTEYRKNRGAAVYCTPDGVVPNTHYIIRSIDYPTPSSIAGRYGLVCGDLLKEFYRSPDKFEFLERPGLMFGKED